MGIRLSKPITDSTSRFYSALRRSMRSHQRPPKSRCLPAEKSGGRNNTGRVTSRRGGGHKRMYRIIDFKRNKIGMEATVATIEYDPNRSARICLLEYSDGEKRYILAPNGVKVGDTLMAGPDAEIRDGNAVPIGRVPLGSSTTSN